MSALMESDEDVELTPDMLTHWTAEHMVLTQHEEPVTAVPSPPQSAQTETEGVMVESVTAVSPYDPVGDTALTPKVV
ncbi:MAG: hypothetical protein HC806_01950, partial [Anaerolineae bacterium]|nr:hypothetical protein [Anaerolineae bacterium]